MTNNILTNSNLHFVKRQLYLEQVSLTKLADECGTPAYVYSKHEIEKNWQAFDRAFSKLPHQVCYAVKACSNIAILNLLAKLGSGFDVVSGGELERVRKAGGDTSKIVFSGIGKQRWEIKAALQAGIACFNVESASELRLIEHLASELECVVPVAIRINPDVDAETHPHISTGMQHNKFGVDMNQAVALYETIRQSPFLQECGIGCHIGSQIVSLEPYSRALSVLLDLANRLRDSGLKINHIDIGGGFGICYQSETPPSAEDYAETIMQVMGEHSYQLILEPGRFIVGNAGLLLTKVLYLKQAHNKHFAIVDAAMNDLLRPALYNAWHHIVPLETHHGEAQNYDIVGPVCESADTFAYDRPLNLYEGDYIALLSAGAYSFSMSSNYNTRTRAVEVIVDDKDFHIIRLRESMQDLIETECLLP